MTTFIYPAFSINGFVLGVYLQQTAGLSGFEHAVSE